jgi:hypothetical protein
VASEDDANQSKEPFWISLLIRVGIIMILMGAVEGVLYSSLKFAIIGVVGGLVILGVGYAARKL